MPRWGDCASRSRRRKPTGGGWAGSEKGEKGQRVPFPELGGKPVVATFDREQASSDGGAVLLKAADFEVEVALVVKHAVEHEGRVAVGALDRGL